MSRVSSIRPMYLGACSIFRSASSSSAGDGSLTGSSCMSDIPVFEPASTTKPERSSVMATSKPSTAFGPVPMESQKHVPPGRVQLTAISMDCDRVRV